MLAVINLFIYILKMPTLALETVGSDLALLDLAAGHFAKVHFLTSSQVTFVLAREVAGLANKTVRRASLTGFTTTNRSKDYPLDLLSVNMSGEPVGREFLNDFFRILILFLLSRPQLFVSNANFEALDTLSSEFYDSLSAAGDMIIF
jgi:hypothetical protein